MIVSIIITAYNYEKYIIECIESCLCQKNFDDYEILVINDGSTDNTYKLLDKYILSPQVKVFNNENYGIEYSSNFGINMSQGEYIVRVDADDFLYPTFLETMVEKIKDEKCAFIYSDYRVIDENSKEIKKVYLPSFDKEEILTRGDFLATGTLYNKEVLFSVGLYNEETVNTGLESYELIVKLLKLNIFGIHLNKTLFSYRRHNTNMSEVKKSAIINYGKELYKKLNLGIYSTNKYHPYGLIIND